MLDSVEGNAYVGFGTVLGVGLGVVFGRLLFDELAVGIGVGVAVAIAIGAGLISERANERGDGGDGERESHADGEDEP